MDRANSNASGADSCIPLTNAPERQFANLQCAELKPIDILLDQEAVSTLRIAESDVIRFSGHASKFNRRSNFYAGFESY
jgi:hypothetical protein